MVGTWEIDVEATRDHKKNAALTSEDMEKEITSYSEDKTRFTYGKGIAIYTYNKSSIREETLYRVRLLGREDNKLILDVKSRKKGWEHLKSIFDTDDDLEEVYVLGPDKIAFIRGSKGYIVLKKVK